MKVYQEIALLIIRIKLYKTTNPAMSRCALDTLQNTVKQNLCFAPYVETFANINEADPEKKVVFDIEYTHSMSEENQAKFNKIHAKPFRFGMSRHTATVIPSLAYGFRLNMAGPNTNYVRNTLEINLRWALYADLSDRE